MCNNRQIQEQGMELPLKPLTLLLSTDIFGWAELCLEILDLFKGHLYDQFRFLRTDIWFRFG